MNAAVFGGSRTTEEIIEETVKIGQMLAYAQYHVKTGGYNGVMAAAPKGAKEAGGTSTGYTCATFPTTQGNEHLTETVVTDDLYHRLKLLIEGTDLFVIQRGGIGTFAELWLTLDIIRKKKKSERPKVVLVGNEWNAVLDGVRPLLRNGELNGVYVIADHTELSRYL